MSHPHADTWALLEEALASRAMQALRGLRPPAHPHEVRAAEASLGLTLPEGIRGAYLRHDGQVIGSPSVAPPFPSFFFSCDWLPLGNVVATWRANLELAAQTKALWERVRGDIDQSGKVKLRQYWYPGWVPIAQNSVGQGILIDLDPGDAGHRGQLVQFDSEGGVEGDESVLAVGFDEYLSWYLTALTAGKVLCLDEWTDLHGEPVFAADLATLGSGAIPPS